MNLKAKGYRSSGGANPESRQPPQPSVTVENEKAREPEFPEPKHRSTWSSDEPDTTAEKIRQYTNEQQASRRTSAGAAPEGFAQHRMKMKREAERHHIPHSSQLPHSPLGAKAPLINDEPNVPLEKSKSWEEKFGHAAQGQSRRFDPPESRDGQSTAPKKDSGYNTLFFAPTQTFSKRMHELSSKGEEVQKHHMLEKLKEDLVGTYVRRPEGGLVQGSPFDDARGKDKMKPSNQANHGRDSSFYFHDSSGSASPDKNPSAENVSKPFSQAEWHSKFFDEEGASYLSPQKSEPPRGRSSPSKGRPAQSFPPRGASQPHTDGTTHPDMTQIPPPSGVVPPLKPSPAKFSKEEWDAQFKENSWAYPQVPGSPRAGNVRKSSRSAGRKMSSATRRPPVFPKPATVSMPTEKGEELENVATNGTKNDESLSSGSVMDIDPKNTPPPAKPLPGGQDPITNIIRSAVPPSATDSAPSPGNQKNNGEASAAGINLADLKSTAPLAPSASGLADLNDLNTTLPFQSGTSSKGPNGTANAAPQHLALPKPPRAPAHPNTARLNRADFEAYLAAMHVYVAEWHAHNGRMLAHFNARQASVVGVDSGPPDTAWVASKGSEGYLRYMAGIKEDFRVREHWDLSWEKHREAMEVFGEARKQAAAGKFVG